MFILAEYCRGPFYDGWWLYERDTNDGRPNAEYGLYGGWGWLRDDFSERRVCALVRRMGCAPPAVVRHTQDFAEWFAARFPNGLGVRVLEYGYDLEHVVERRPKQRRRNIRTICGAAMSDRAGRLRMAASTTRYREQRKDAKVRRRKGFCTS